MDAATIIIRRSRNGLVVQAAGQTSRGQKYIKGHEAITATTMKDKNFKSEVQTAVDKLLGSEA
jgi:hypothetical protein